MRRLFILIALLGPRICAAEPVVFSRDVLPVMSANCFACHGPDEKERKAKLRLDVESEAKKEHEDGLPIAPGRPEQSSVIARLITKDTEDVMPPPKSHKTVKPEQIETMRRWIAEGAKWGQHWSFEPVKKPAGTLDAQVNAALAAKGLALQKAASPHALVRRLSLDIIGLPPTPQMADAFAQDPSPAAYEKLVDSLLEKPQFGEHWARMWLDLARYADTKGYEKDLGRTMWPYRDWVVNAFNADMPLDQFTREQLAGDLLPKPTEPQTIATAFHRNTMVNEEGGTDIEEFRVVAVKDRVDTTIQVWMGLTMGCAKCHTHKYDPISQEDYYRFYALFNQTEDANREPPTLSKPTPEQSQTLTAATRHLNELRTELAKLSGKELKAKDLETANPADKPDVAKLKGEVKKARDAVKSANDQIVALPIMRELPANKARVTKVHRRGNFLDPGDEIKPALLPSFHKVPDGTPMNRLGVADWLVSKDNPLTPRVWANRIWARLFGLGIVETEEDFGALGTPPSNAALLDWLAASYRDSGWSLKKLIKVIVMSDTYRQASTITPALREADPRNALASRGARFRLSAEQVRDSSLAVAGLLSSKMGGPPVMPPQPAGLWRSTYSSKSWIDAEGEDRFRRGLYTYLKRTTPYPSFTTFDGGSGEVCQIRRIRTNTPLQALVTMNDPVYLEAAAALAKRMIASSNDDAARAAHGMRLALIRPLRDGEAKPLLALLHDARADFTAAPEKAESMLKTSRADLGDMKATDFAAWVVVANAILNLDEFLTRN